MARTWLYSAVLGQVARLSAGRVAAAMISATWMIIAARKLPVSAFGDLALILALGMIFSSFADFGLTSLLAETVARHPEMARHSFVWTVRVRLLLSLGGASAVGVAYVSAAHDHRPIVPLVFAASIIATTIYSSTYALLRAQGRVGTEAATEVLSRLFVLALGTWLLFHGGGLLAAISTYAASDVVSAAVLGGIGVISTSKARGPAPSDLLTLRLAAPLALAGWVGTLYYRVDIYILALLGGAQSVGLYASCYRIFDALLLPTTAIASLAIPLTATLSPGSQLRRLAKLCVLGLLITVPAGGLIAAYSSRVLRFVLGPRYGTAGSLLTVLMLGVVPTVIAGVIAPRVTLRDGQAVSRAFACCLVVDVAVNVAAIPAYGAYAAAWATVVSQTLLAVLIVRVLLRQARGYPGRGSGG